jgi:hypothetical protein
LCAGVCVHRAACVSLQDLSYLLRDNYAATMQGWLSSAVWLQEKELQTLDQYCSPSQPPDPDTRDLILLYKDNQEFSDISGQKLAPMMWHVSTGVSDVPCRDCTVAWVTCRGWRHSKLEAQLCVVWHHTAADACPAWTASPKVVKVCCCCVTHAPTAGVLTACALAAAVVGGAAALQGKVPRGSYNGTVAVRCRGRRLFLVLEGKQTRRRRQQQQQQQ